MSQPYRTLAERCEIFAVELDDSGDKMNAQLLWEADSRIRELEAEAVYLRERRDFYVNEAQRLALLVRSLGGAPEPTGTHNIGSTGATSPGSTNRSME